MDIESVTFVGLCTDSLPPACHVFWKSGRKRGLVVTKYDIFLSAFPPVNPTIRMPLSSQATGR